ncbi:hypothetical protein L210DRAFT_3504470 [Boletus edulis BED1]|uniref:Peptidase M3A/M3B catalytic domain-containing protein n=1 Tax=Boletus edulis BED1 TaxID=1328754 RepID=A0AAD4BTG2_BOLED|nr:hypothetical protein L210DRAFT_3504470 [Boletus edulis BED1]
MSPQTGLSATSPPNLARAQVRQLGYQESICGNMYKTGVTAAANLRKIGAWDTLSAERKLLVDKMLLGGRRAGLGTEGKEEGEIEARTCTKGDRDRVSYEVTFRTSDVFPVFKYANDPKTREAAQQAFDDRLANNAGYLDTTLRRSYSTILGGIISPRSGWSKVQLTQKSFWMILKHIPLSTQERATLLGLKKEVHTKRGLPIDDNLYIWDYRHAHLENYSSLYYDVERNLDLDDSLVKEYFPVSVVVPAILDIYQNLLGVKFVEITGDARDVWHPEGKYSHATVWGLLPGYELPERKRYHPLTAMVANLPGETNTGATNADAPRRYGTCVPRVAEPDEILTVPWDSRRARLREAPSQMLENWCWEPEVLKKMSSHYKTQEPLSDDLIAKIIKRLVGISLLRVRYVNVGLFYLRQLFFANFDLAVHNNSLDVNTDYTKLWNELREKISLVQGSEDKPELGYYGYTYSLVFAADMYATVFKKAPLDPTLGRLYREKILFVGGSRDDMDSLKDFLGREPDPKAFINEIEQDGNGDAARASNL